MLGLLPQRPGGPDYADKDHNANQHIAQIFPARGLKADVFEQVELFALCVIEYPLRPRVVDGLPHGPKLRCESRINGAQRLADQPLGCCQPLRGAGSARCHSRGGVYTGPATPFVPDFSPGMCVTLAHHPKTVHRILLTPLIARDHTRRHIECPHQNHKRRGDVLAKTFLALVPEIIGCVGPVQARLQRVGVATGTQAIHDKVGQYLVACIGELGITANSGCF